MEISIAIATEAVIWIFCTVIAIATWLLRIDLGPWGLLLWVVFILGVVYAVKKFLDP